MWNYKKLILPFDSVVIPFLPEDSSAMAISHLPRLSNSLSLSSFSTHRTDEMRMDRKG